MKRTLAVLTAGALTLGAGSAAQASPRHEAPVGYHFDVSTKAGYLFRDLRHEDGRPGTWNAAERGNGRGVSYFTTQRQRMTIGLGVNDHRQGDTAPASDGVVAWRRHGIMRVHNEVIYRLHGYVAEVDTTVETTIHGKHRVFYVLANAIWR